MPAKIPGQKKKQRKKAPPDDLDSVEPLDDDDEGQSSRRVLFSGSLRDFCEICQMLTKRQTPIEWQWWFK